MTQLDKVEMTVADVSEIQPDGVDVEHVLVKDVA